MNSSTILYIHGFGSDANSSTAKEISKGLGANHKVMTHSFNNSYELVDTMIENIEVARKLIKDNNIDLVVGTSMGAFIAINCHDITKVINNPCMLPSEQLKLRAVPEITDTELEKYKELESSLIISPFDKDNTYGLFGMNDELFSYIDLFKKKYNPKNIYTMDDRHQISNENIHNKLVPLIIEAIRKL